MCVCVCSEQKRSTLYQISIFFISVPREFLILQWSQRKLSVHFLQFLVIFFSLFCDSDHMLLGVGVGLGVHLMVTCVVPNRPLIHASEGKP